MPAMAGSLSLAVLFLSEEHLQFPQTSVAEIVAGALRQ